MSRGALLGLLALILAAPAPAASAEQAATPETSMPSAAASGGEAAPSGADMPGMPGMKGMDMSQPAQGQTPAGPPTASPPDIPATPPPPPPQDHAADRYYDPAAMAAASAILRREHGGAALGMATVNLAEYQAGPPGGGYRWDARAWFGGDIDRLVVKSEGEGNGRDGVDAAEAQALYAHAIDPYFDVQAGVRQDFGPGLRTYATAGVEGLLPYWVAVEAALFLSTRGELLARAEGTYDLRLAQRVILQPRVELNFAAQDTPDTRTGSGLSNAELGLRLRYQIRPEFAPYIGVSYDRKLGRTADYARLKGEDAGGVSFVAGVRAWF